MGGPVPSSIPEAVEPVEVDAVPNVVEDDPIAVRTDEDAMETEAVSDGWLTSQELIDLLTSQGIEALPSLRTLQHWAKDFKGTKPGFSPPYTAEKIKGKLMWKPA